MPLEQFVFGFYLKLRQRGLSLTVGEYKIFLEALQAGLGLESENDFLETCQLLWCKSLEQREIVQGEFKFYHQRILAEIIEIDRTHNIKEEERSSATSSTTGVVNEKGNERDKDTKISEGKKKKDTDKKASITDQGKELTEQKQRRLEPHNAPVIAFYPSSEKENSLGSELNTSLYSSDVDYIHSPFILTSEYLPLSLRQMQQSWRRLRHFKSSVENIQSIDWKQTVGNTAQKGFFSKLVHPRMRKNQFQLVILIDHHGSMVSHWEIGQQLVEAAKREGGYPDVRVYYTHNIPSKYLYKTSYHTDSISIEDMLLECNPRHSVFLFFSDAGASRGLFNAQRVIATKRFVALLSKKVHSVAWLNPMPKARWENTSAELIKRLVPMFECTEDGIDGAIKTLKSGNNGGI